MVHSTLKNLALQRTLLAILLLGLLEGVIYTVIVPAWWHYDEPGHFEYVWLVANLTSWPKVDQYDQGMRREMAISMTKSGWYQIRNYHPDFSSSQPIPIGVSQLHDPPAYYFLSSLPLRFMHAANITAQYYGARAVSFVLYLLILLVVWYALGEILPDGHSIRWMVCSFLATLPAFVDTMTAVNNDVIAVLASTLFLWASLKLMKQGYSFRRFLFLGLSLALCYLSKNTAWYTFLLSPFVLIFGVLRGRFKSLVLGSVGIGLVIAAFILFQWDAPAGWYQSPSQAPPLRVRSTTAPMGNYIFQIDYSGANTSGHIVQFLSLDIAKSIKGQTITLGAWLWADHPIQISFPYITILDSDNTLVNSLQTPLSLNTSPTFYRLVFHVPEGAYYATISIPYVLQPPTNKIFFDGLVLASGEFSNTPPRFTDQNGSRGNWDGQDFQNLIHNGSAEQGSLRIRYWVDSKTTRLVSGAGVSPPLILSTIQDWQGNGWYYQDAFATLFRTFWASLAGDKVVLSGSFVSYFLGLVTLLGAAGAVRLIWAKRKDLPFDSLLILGMSLAIVWTLAVTRGVSNFQFNDPFFFPWARYAYPAILPTALLLCAGWWEWLELLKARMKYSVSTLNGIFLSCMLGLSVLAMITAIQAFHQQWWLDWRTLLLLLIFQLTAFLVILRFQSRQKLESHVN